MRGWIGQLRRDELRQREERVGVPRRAFLGLGSNVGDRRGLLREALGRIDALPATRVLRTSSLYETEPWGGVPQPRYLNLVAEIETGLAPEELLEHVLAIEADLGRVRTVRWGPRTIDVDLLWMEGEERATERLTLPHPRLVERAFVLVPLAELDGQVVVRGRQVAAWLNALVRSEGDVVRVGEPLWPQGPPAGPSIRS
ncbi:MAG TPA: 2-amino-4-hydroxy-6-hydroxymethyldihydropteridine diphosphokinase [Limnochorda sp.]